MVKNDHVEYPLLFGVKINQRLLDLCPTNRKFAPYVRELIENTPLLKQLYNLMQTMSRETELTTEESKLIDRIEEVLKK